jgi:hypothetical protein
MARKGHTHGRVYKDFFLSFNTSFSSLYKYHFSPLSLVLFFPAGMDGWNLTRICARGLRHVNGSCRVVLSCLQGIITLFSSCIGFFGEHHAGHLLGSVSRGRATYFNIHNAFARSSS